MGPRCARNGGRASGLPGSRLWTSERICLLAACGLLLSAVGVVFGQAASFSFVNYDDNVSVYENRFVTGGLTLRRVLAVFTEHHVDSGAPLTCVSHMLVWRIFGSASAPHHLTNVFLHAATSIVLFLLLRRMTRALWPSAFVAAVFAIHPLRAESVAWVTERKDVLCGFFFVLTLAAYLGYVRRPFSLARYLAVLACFTASLAAKPMAVTLPFLLWLLDYWPLEARGERGEGKEGGRRKADIIPHPSSFIFRPRYLGKDPPARDRRPLLPVGRPWSGGGVAS